MEENSGCYQLFIELVRPVTVLVGALGKCSFPAGLYIYTGSHRRHLRQRIRRHLRRQKTLRWHIDYLTARTEFSVWTVVVFPGSREECALHQEFRKFSGATEPYPGFGSSDCRNRCFSHLSYLPKLPSDLLNRWVATFSDALRIDSIEEYLSS